MSRWEDRFNFWAQPPSASENQRSENAINAIKNAIGKSEKLKQKAIKVFVQGSYRNRVNVRQDSDVDVGVMLYDVFLVQYPEGMSDADFGMVGGGYTYSQFKDDLGDALISYFGASAVKRGNKAFDIHENTYHVEADVVPLFEYRRYWQDGTYRAGVALIPDNGWRIENFPERLVSYWPYTPLHYENAVAKNQLTSRSFKGIVRILKKLRIDMDDNGVVAAKSICGYLIECLVWNTPNERMLGHSWEPKVRSVISYLWDVIKSEDLQRKWFEVDNIKYLFHPSQPWSQKQAFDFIDAAWDHIGVNA